MSHQRTVAAILFLCFLFVGAGNSFAEQLPNYTWAVGPELSYFAYEEPHFAETRGFLAGVTGSFAYHDNFMLRADGRFSFGSLYYTSPVSGTMSNVPDYIGEFRGVGGYDFSVSGGSVLTPYIGIGYRYLNDNSSGKVTSLGASGYERESNYYYSPVGVMLATNATAGWSTETAIEYDIFWHGKQISHLSDVDPTSQDVDNNQNRGYGLRGSIAFKRQADAVKYSIEPFIRYWNVRDSEVAFFFDASAALCGSQVCIGLEPANHSTEYGINFLIEF